MPHKLSRTSDEAKSTAAEYALSQLGFCSEGECFNQNVMYLHLHVRSIELVRYVYRYICIEPKASPLQTLTVLYMGCGI